MQSVAQVYGPLACGVVLTGMGNDGTQGLLAIRGRGGRTFAQEPASCVIDGMPRRAIERGVVDHVGPPADLAVRLATGGRGGGWEAAKEPVTLGGLRLLAGGKSA